eukprot:5600160-Amphidinium_carterae.1
MAAAIDALQRGTVFDEAAYMDTKADYVARLCIPRRVCLFVDSSKGMPCGGCFRMKEMSLLTLHARVLCTGVSGIVPEAKQEQST